MSVRTKSERGLRETGVSGDIARRLADGDPGAPRDLVSRHYGELYRYARVMLKDDAEAEDAVHDALVKALEALGRYPAERVRGMRIRAWLYRISLNEVRNRVRRSKRRREVSLSGYEFAASEVDTDGVMDVLGALAGLPEKQRIALTLRHMQDLTYAEIAVATGWPENTAKTLVRRGVISVRKRLSVAETGKEEA